MERVQAFLLDFAKKVGVEAFVDPAGNVLMRKPATPGYENRKGVILQAHMDMVPQKSPESNHIFETDPIELTLQMVGFMLIIQHLVLTMVLVLLQLWVLWKIRP